MRISGITFVQRKRKSRLKTFIKFFIPIVIVLIIGLTGYLSYVGYALTHPPRKAIVVSTDTVLPGFKIVTFHDRKKTVKLDGWFYSSPGSDKTIILCHGYKDNRTQFKPLMIQKFIEGGYNVLTFDFRDCGESEGKFTSVGYYEQYDLLGAIDFVKEKYPGKIAVMGWSMGAATAIIASSEDNDVSAVIADSPFSDMTDYLNAQLPVWSHIPPKWTHIPAGPFNKIIILSAKFFAGLSPSKVSPRKVIANLAPRPLLLIHSKDDDAISVNNSKELYKIYSKVTSNAEFWESSGAGHVATYKLDPDVYMSRVIGFLDKAFQA